MKPVVGGVVPRAVWTAVGRSGLAAGLVLAQLACSPALNWREVHLDRMTARLPCKPDHAQRMVHLGRQEVALEMVGCEAEGALFAISHVRLQDIDHAADVLVAWRSNALSQLQSTQVTGWVNRPGHATEMLTASGRRSDGSAVQAQLAWWVRGADIFHAAVYADRVTPEMADTFFSEPRIQ